MAVTLPLVLFLMDYFHDRKIDYRSIIEKIPFFVLSILSGIVTLFAQRVVGTFEPGICLPHKHLCGMLWSCLLFI